jgi:hypothetical protein
LFTRAPCTRMKSWLFAECLDVLPAMVLNSPLSSRAR